MKWIKCSEQMPNKKENKEILTFEYVIHIDSKRKIPCICIEETKELYINSIDNSVGSYGGGENITHWMPLPEIPKKDLP